MKSKNSLYVIAFLMASLVHGCAELYTPPNGEDGLGSASVRATVAGLSADEVTAIQITVSGPNISPDIVSDLTQDPGTGDWSGTIENIPAGTNRTFLAEASNASAEVVYAGSATGVTITDGQQVVVNLFLQQTTPPDPFVNTVPIFDSLVLSSVQVAPGNDVTLTVAVTDPDPGDVLTLLWTATGGSFDATNTASVVWTAPTTEASYSLTVAASDSTGATSTLTVTIDVGVQFGSGSASVQIDLNTWPEVQNLVPSPTRIDVGETTQLDLTASDPDGDPLTYSWSADCMGTFSDASVEDPSFTLDIDNAGATCSLSVALNDTRGGSNSASVSVATGPPIFEGRWFGQRLIGTDSEAVWPDVAVDANGNAIAVWTESEGSGTATNVYANRLTSGVWGGPEPIRVTDNPIFPQVGVDATGDAVVVWQEDYLPASEEVVAIRLTSGVWGSPEPLESDIIVAETQVAVNPGGDAIVVWNRFDLESTLRAIRLTSGVWGSPVWIDKTDPLAEVIGFSVALDPSGNAVAVSGNENDEIYANRLTSGVWGGPELLQTTAGIAGEPRVGIDADGDAVAVWWESVNMYANRLTSGAWGGPEPLETNPGTANRPQLAVAANGEAVAVWRQSDGSVFNIYANRLTSGAWGGPELLETDNAGDANQPQVGIDADGDAFVVWIQSDGNVFNVYANRLTSEVWGGPELLEANPGSADQPRVAVGSNGGAVAVWIQSDGTRQNIWANRF